MKTLLRIDASIRMADSHTRKLTSYFEKKWLKENPGARVIRRCLATAPVPHLTQETFEAFSGTGDHAATLQLSDLLIGEMKSADHLLIGSPLYNLNLPSSLKAYFDHTVRSGITFEVSHGAYRGLLRGRGATLITARAGYSSPDCHDDFQKAYLKQILAFIGITEVEIVALEGMDEHPKREAHALAAAQRAIDRVLCSSASPAWQGEFTDIDRQEINCLRDSQAAAIVAGDAQAYAALCTEDVQLLIPGRDMISGRVAFLQAEEAIFRNARFNRFRKSPVCVQRSGDLVVEVGRQSVDMQYSDRNEGIFSRSQKYTHVFRRTGNGWRIAVLMSSPNE